MQGLSRALEFDLPRATTDISQFIQKFVEDARVNGVVLGLSGGIDSSVVGSLCVKALGREKVLGLLMPAAHTPADDIDDAIALVRMWGIQSYRVDIDGTVNALLQSIPIKTKHRIALANAKARTRMMVNYYFANMLNYAVAGTGDKSEDLIGYFTKYGDGGVDFLPIAHLYKTQVRKLGAFLGVMQRVVEKPSSPQLWEGHKATDEIPLDYDKLDTVLYGLFEAKMNPDDVALTTGVDKEAIGRILRMHAKSAHKRTYPPMVRPW